MSDTPERSAHDPEHEPHSDAPKEPPITIEQWLAAAPKPGEADVAAKTELPLDDALEWSAEPELPIEPPEQTAESEGQPVDVVPIAGMTPISEEWLPEAPAHDEADVVAKSEFPSDEALDLSTEAPQLPT